jgi:hypothetical protein
LGWTRNEIERSKKNIDASIKNKDECNELPRGQIEHIMKHAKSFPKRDSYFYQVIGSIFIDEAAAGIVNVARKAGIVVDFRKRIYFFIQRHVWEI